MRSKAARDRNRYSANQGTYSRILQPNMEPLSASIVFAGFLRHYDKRYQQTCRHLAHMIGEGFGFILAT